MAQLFHVFRNTPAGRESLLQSLYFCRQIQATPVVYIARHIKFLMYFQNDVVQVDLELSDLASPETAESHARELIQSAGLDCVFITPRNFTSPTLPDIPTHFDFMSCPESIRDLKSKIGPGFIGGRVMRIVKSAPFPVLVPSPGYQPWNAIAVLFGGAANAATALKTGLRIRRITGMPLILYTVTGGVAPEAFRRKRDDARIDGFQETEIQDWVFFESGSLQENIYELPHDSLVVMGGTDHGLMRDMILGSTMEKVQSLIRNNLLIVGSRCDSSV